MKHLLTSCAAIMAVAWFGLFGVSCSETETTDKTPFVIYYSGLTDIGPSMEGVVSSPTYKGEAPSQFAITQISLNGEPYVGEGFTISPDNGAISISNTKDMLVGLYSLSISCQSSGTTHLFENVVEVNLMASVPDGITVEPALLKVDYAEIINTNSVTVLPTAQVVTEGEHVSISKYEIIGEEHKGVFAISQTGEISIVKGNQAVIPGNYKLNLKLTTKAGEGIFENAVEINITSKPLSITFTPNVGKIEEETVSSTTYTSSLPLFKGSIEGLAYSIKEIRPATDKITIDATTGVLSVAANHGFKANESYAIDLNITNEFAPEGVEMKDVFTLEVVSFIAPVENLIYSDATCTQATSFELMHTEAFKGDEAIFELIDLDANLQGQLLIDHLGTITAKKGNNIPLGTYTINVQASNSKSTTAASFSLTIKENQNFFSFIKYGNNLSQPVDENAFQYRVHSAEELEALDIPAPTTDIRSGIVVKWSVEAKHQMSGTTISETGQLKFVTSGWKEAQCGLVIVTATVGEGEEAVSMSVPVFFHYSTLKNGVSVEYTPFVIQADPRKQTRSASPKLTGVADESKFVMDYRRSFNYYSIGNSNHKSGEPKVSGSFMQGMWKQYFEKIGKTPNYSSKDPVSHYANAKDLNQALLYVDKDLSIVVNPNKWTDGEYANGAMIGQMTFVTDGNTGLLNGSKNQIFPIFIYLK